MAFDIAGAKKAGYSDGEIADFLGKQSGFDVAGARKSGYSDAEILAHLAQQGAPEPAHADESSPVADKIAGAWDALGRTAGNVTAGAVRGAGSIGATILAPIDVASDLAAGRGLTLQSNRERRQAMDDALRSLGADPDSAAFQIGKLGTEVAGTAGAGGVLANGARAIGMGPRFVAALGSGGFNVGQALPRGAPIAERAAEGIGRAIAGATTGAAQAGLIDPEQAGTGALVGGALPGAVKVAGEAGKLAGKVGGSTLAHLIGGSTGTSAESIAEAARAGFKGGTDYLENASGAVSANELVDRARKAIDVMRAQRQQAYKAGMAKVSGDRSVLDMAPIHDALQDVINTGKFEGQEIRSNASETVDKLAGIVNDWSRLQPSRFHTPEGLDALKQKIYDLRETTQHGTGARMAVDRVAAAVKQAIVDQAPVYADVMKGYQKASEELSDIVSGLSLGEKSSKDTIVRKLQSVMRNNAQTNYGNRLRMVDTLAEKGGDDMMPALAGQATNSWLPRGVVGQMERMAVPLAGFLHPQYLAAMPFMSPRLMGLTAYGAGAAARGVARAGSFAAPAAGSALRTMIASHPSQALDVARSVPLVMASAGNRITPP